ncbi:MAG: LacI family DNA-binding transcriptional regulator [Gammaproteobacteria bacterium]
MSPQRKSTRVTIADVAARAGVSVMTVSRVVNRDDKVKASTRATVEKAIAELNYTPNVAARALAGGTVRRICLLYGNPSSAYLGDLLTGALEAAVDAGVHLMVERTDPTLDPSALADRLGRDWDAVIVPPPMSDIAGIRTLVRERGFPAVFLCSATESGRANEIRIDDRKAAFEMTQCLLEKGHERIGFIQGHPNQTVSEARLTGYQDALDAAGLALDADLIQPGLFNYRSGQLAGATLLDLRDRPTAIFASNDDMAAGCLAAAAAAGIQVPEELAIAGFDDSSIASVVWPPLTTLRQPVSEMAAMAVRTVLALRDGHSQPNTRIVEHTIIERGTTIPRAGNGHADSRTLRN